jgi:antitoxin HicB
MQYTILIQWSDEDNCFVVSLPDFADIMQPCTHGETYIEAIQNAQEVLEMLVESALKNRNPLPKRQRFQTIPLSPQVA